MKRILIIALALCHFAYCIAQKSEKTQEEKEAQMYAISGLISDKDYIQAQNVLDKFISKYGLTSDALMMQAIQLTNQGKTTEAIEKIDRAIAIVTKDDLISKSSLYNTRSQYCEDLTDKIKYLTLSIKEDKKNYNSYTRRAQVYKTLNKYDEAKKDLKKAVRYSSKDPNIRTELARIYILEDNKKQAIKELNDILETSPNIPEARRLRALIAFYDQQYYEFVDNHLYYLQLTNDLDFRYLNEAVDTVYDYIQDYADQILEHVTEPEEKAYWEYFEAHIKIYTSRDIEGGLAHTERALKLTKDSNELRGKILALQLVSYGSQGNEDKQLEIIGEIMKIIEREGSKPANWILTTKSRIMVQKKQYNEALLCYRQTIDNNREDSSMVAYCYYQMTNINKDMGNRIEALNCIDSALMYQPNHIPFLYKHARLCSKFTDEDKAYTEKIKADCEKILALDTVPSVESYRHFALAMMKRKAEAEEWLQKIFDLLDENFEMNEIVKYNGACMYSLLNDVYNATRLLMDIMDNNGFSCEQLNNDSDFDNIRQTPEFQSILRIVCSNLNQ